MRVYVDHHARYPEYELQRDPEKVEHCEPVAVDLPEEIVTRYEAALAEWLDIQDHIHVAYAGVKFPEYGVTLEMVRGIKAADA